MMNTLYTAGPLQNSGGYILETLDRRPFLLTIDFKELGSEDVQLVMTDLSTGNVIYNIEETETTFGIPKHILINRVVDSYNPDNLGDDEKQLQLIYAKQLRKSLDVFSVHFPELMEVDNSKSIYDYLGNLKDEEMYILSSDGVAFYIEDNYVYCFHTERLDNGCDTLRAYMSPVDQLYFTHADPLELLGSEEECNQVAAKIIDAYKYTTTSRFSGFMDTYLPLVRYIAIDSLESMAEDMQSSIDEEEEDEVYSFY